MYTIKYSMGVGGGLTSTDRVTMLAQNLTCYEISNNQCHCHKKMIISVIIIMITSEILYDQALQAK